MQRQVDVLRASILLPVQMTLLELTDVVLWSWLVRIALICVAFAWSNYRFCLSEGLRLSSS